MSNLDKNVTPIEIDGRVIGPGQPCFIIAEVGVNHNGDPDLAIKMIDAIAAAGADCVKFQTFSAEEFVNNPEDTYEYISQGKVVKESMLKMFKRLELRLDEFRRLFDYAREKGLIALSTPTDRQAADLVDELGTAAFKIGSDDLVYIPYLDYVARKGKPMIISSGMANQEDIKRAIETIRRAGNDQIILLHCVSLYPTPEDKLNLLKIPHYQGIFKIPVGFSDHSFGITAALGSVALGGCIIEKHFTLDRDLPGPDHRFSAIPDELEELVCQVRILEKSLGRSGAVICEDEQRMADLCHRSIYAGKTLKTGQILSDRDVVYQRPGDGLLPYEIENIVGKKLIRDVQDGEQLSTDMFESLK